MPTACFMSFILRTLLWRINDDNDDEAKQRGSRSQFVSTHSNYVLYEYIV